MNDPQPKRSLFGIPVMWLVIGLPLASIVAGVGLVIVAIRSGGADVVRDEVQRTSQIQVTDLSADEQAMRRNLSALMRAAVRRYCLSSRSLRLPNSLVRKLAIRKGARRRCCAKIAVAGGHRYPVPLPRFLESRLPRDFCRASTGAAKTKPAIL